MESNSRGPAFEMNEKVRKNGSSEKVSFQLVLEILQRVRWLECCWLSVGRNVRVSNRSAGLISRSLRETFWWKFSRIQGFWNCEFQLKWRSMWWQAPSKAYHSVIQPSLTVTVTAEYETRCFYGYILKFKNCESKTTNT